MVTGALGRLDASRWTRLRRALPAAVLLAALTAWFLPIALGRLIDGDEGYLLMAARLVGEGRWPYRDFFLTQAPLLPAVFAVVFRTFGRSWLIARAFAGLLAVAMGWLVYRETQAATRKHAPAVFATAAFALGGWSIGWLTIVKGYGLSAVWLLLAVRWVGSFVRGAGQSGDPRRPLLGLFAAGTTVGLAASTRLYVVVVMPALAVYWVAKLGLGRQVWRRLAAYGLGFLAGLLPTLLCFLRAPGAFVFDALLFHASREYGQDSLLGTVGGKLPIILKTVGLDAEATYGERQWMALAMVAIAAAVLRLRWRDGLASPAWLVALVVMAASVLPNPFLPQYLCLIVPFLAIEAGRLLGTLLDHVPARSRTSAVLVVAAAAYVIYNGWVGWHARHRFLYSGANVDGVWSRDRVPRWRIGTVEAVAKAIDEQHVAIGASWWPGYFVSAQTGIEVALANDFGFRAAAVLPLAEERRRLRVVGSEEVAEMIGRRQPRLFVEGNWAHYPAAWTLPQRGYRLRATVENAKIWTAN